MIISRCMGCGCVLEIDLAREGEGYFLGYDSDYYGDAGEQRDPHEVVGYYCQACGEKLRAKAEAIGWRRTD